MTSVTEKTDINPINVPRRYAEAIKNLRQEPGFTKWNYKNITQKMYDGSKKGVDDRWNRCDRI
jgi:hypothetical protein